MPRLKYEHVPGLRNNYGKFAKKSRWGANYFTSPITGKGIQCTSKYMPHCGEKEQRKIARVEG